MRRYWRWLSGVGAANFLLVSVCGGAWGAPFGAGEIGSAKAMAGTGGGAVNQRLSTSEGLNSHATQPLTSSDRPLTTVDGAVSGAAQLSQASSSAFLEVFIKPGGSGDLQTVILSQDLDLNGAFDATYSAPGAVSGICSNGYVSCDAGTWNNCTFRAWRAQPDGRIQAVPVAISQVSGCYCINNSCGANLAWQNLPLVLNNLGGGAAGAVVQGNPNLQITQSKTDPETMTVRFYGQDLSHDRSLADGTKVPTGTVPETGYFARPGQTAPKDLAADSQAEVTTQQADSTSYYSMMRGVSDNIGANTSLQTCSQTRTLSFSSPVIPKSDPYPPGAVLREKPLREYYRVYSHFERIKDDCRIGKRPAAYPDYHWTPTDAPVYDSAVSPPSSVDTGKVDYVYLDCDKRDGKDKGSYDVYRFWLLESRMLDMAAEAITDNCSALAADSNCTLWGEKVDGVDVVRNGGATGLVPQPSPQTFVGQLQAYTIVRDWWHKERTYRCTSNNGPYDFSDAMKRVTMVTDSANQAPNQATAIAYNDIRQGVDPRTRSLDGAWSAETGTITLPPADPTTGCVSMCKTRIPVLGTDITLSSTADQQRADNTGANPLPANQQWKFSFKECDALGCPTEPGESVVKDCQCLNEFAEATVVVETLNRAGKDIICTDGVKK